MNMSALNYTNYCTAAPVNSWLCKSYYLTAEASYIATITGSVSAVSSFAILIIATRSLFDHGSVYHRIMMGVSFFDLMSSIAIALTTTAMPSDVIYPYEGRRVYGTVATCEAQGFLFVFGCVGSFLMISGLSIFYASLIQFRMSDHNLRKVLEPIVHFVAWAGAIGASVTFLLFDLFNPGLYDPWCSANNYPYLCQGDNCIRGGILSSRGQTLFTIILLLVLCGGVLNIIICMSCIICGTWMKNEYFFPRESTSSTAATSQSPPGEQLEEGEQEQLEEVEQEQLEEVEEYDEEEEQYDPSQQQTSRISSSWSAMRKTLIRQAFLYVGAFVLTWCFALAGLFVRSDIIDRLYLTFFPLQGFFNASIFIYHKIQNIKTNNPSIPLSKAVRVLFFGPARVTNTVKISGLSIIPSPTPPMQRSRLDEIGGWDNVELQAGSSVEEASKDVQMSSKDELSQEISFMFEEFISTSSKTCAHKKEPKLRTKGDNNQEEDIDSFEKKPDSSNASGIGSNSCSGGLSYSINDESTVQATSRYRQR